MQQHAIATQGKDTTTQQKEISCRRKKRARLEESGATVPKALKFRKSNAPLPSSGTNSTALGSTLCPSIRGDLPVSGKTKRALGSGRFLQQNHLSAVVTKVMARKKNNAVPPKTVSADKQVQKTLNELFYNNMKGKFGMQQTEKNCCANYSSVDKTSKFPVITSSKLVISQVVDCVDFNGSTKIKMETPLMGTLSKSVDRTISLVSTAPSEMSDSDAENRHPTDYLHSLVVLENDRQLLLTRLAATSLRYDSASYGQDWVLHHRIREEKFQPWQMALAGKCERVRLATIECYWGSMKTQNTTPATIFIAISNLGRLLNCWSQQDLEQPCGAKWALTSLVAFRLAFKTEERPESFWEISNFWNLFPIFSEWAIDRSEHNVNSVETQALKVLDDCLDVPLASMFLSQYLAAGGWPAALTPEFHELGLYLIALATFSSVGDNLLRNVVPSKLAAAALALSVKIINGDRCSGQGIVKHLSTCPLACPIRSHGHPNPTSECTCRYEFWPLRLQTYANYSFDELKPVIRGLSILLRSRPAETAILKNYFPTWGDNDWR